MFDKDSYATHEAGIKADYKRIKKYDDEFSELCNSVTVVRIIWLVLLLPPAACFYFSYWISGAILLIPFLLIAMKTWTSVLVLPLMKRRLVQMFELGLVVPGVVIDFEDGKVKILCLANMSASPFAGNHFAVKVLTLSSIEPYATKVGTRFPCCAIFAPGSDQKHADFFPKPLSWGTSDMARMEAIAQDIDEDDWEMLLEVYEAQDFPESDELKFL